ncbi:MAG: diguanylate cyclase [Azonexaceae bacterium]|uniref:diguanylate cyclase domain-containing protein n=1 Tax=Azonexus sp. R2A61 TaxID=2744443 RepID=UPI001F2C2651|nr:diguanylate cyclase [Azonexus sp. R2A61]MCE1240870.1 diguanylate cyclase [Azonexaceae bacterium]
MNRLTLRQRLLLLTLLPSALIALMLVIYFTMSGIGTLETELRAKALATVRALAPISEYGIIAGQTDTLHGLVQATVQEPGVKAAMIVNTRGRTLAVSGRVSLSAEHMRENLASPALVVETDGWMAYGAPVMRSQNEIDPLFDIGIQRTEEQESVGRVFVEFDKEELLQRQKQLLVRGGIVVLVGLALMALLAVALADSLALPLQRLATAVRQMSAGHFDTRVHAGSSGELRVLEDGFNEMAEHIEEVHRSMQSRIEEATAQLVFQARHDALTGLINRREFEFRLERALENLHAGGEEFCVLFIDLDRFKPVNDACGHLAGDELLRQIALLFQGRLRTEDTLGRLGGDEFGVILQNCAVERAQQVASDLCALAAEYRFVWQDKIFAIGASIGLTPVSRYVRDIQSILGVSDSACQQAKEGGRNQVCELRPEVPAERRRERGSWTGRLASALNDGRLLVEALPLRALQAKQPERHFAELSARLNEPGQPPIALSALIDAAERYDMAEAFDRHFLETAFAALRRATQQQRQMTCLIPLSRNAVHGRTADFIASRLAQETLPGDGLWLMFPEELGTHQASQLIEFSRKVRQLGCQIGLSDFGGGLSSFNQLRNIEPHFVKLSQSLTRDLADSRTSTALLRAILEITAEQDICSIAEDVDEPAQLLALQQIGIGYALGQAVAPREPFDAWLEGAVMRGKA